MTRSPDPGSGAPFKAHRRYYLALKVLVVVAAFVLALKLLGVFGGSI